jgi:hypothetical protein
MGMGTDLSLILGIMGTVWTGNPLSLNPGFSIGGPPPTSSGLLGSVTGLLTGKSNLSYDFQMYHNILTDPQANPVVSKAHTTGLNPMPP